MFQELVEIMENQLAGLKFTPGRIGNESAILKRPLAVLIAIAVIAWGLAHG